MKKLTLALLTLATTYLASAQNKNVVSAINYLNYYTQDKKCDDLGNAKQFIDLASNHLDTKESAKMWLNRGKIYQSIAESKDEKCKKLSADALDEAIKSFELTLKYDDKKLYKDEVERRVGMIQYQFITAGVDSYNKQQNFAEALKNYEKALSISSTIFNRIDTSLIYNAAIAADRMKDYGKAKNYYQQLIDLKYGGKKGGRYYASLANTYHELGDSEGFQKVIKKGRETFPEDTDLLKIETNYFLQTGKQKEALSNLNIALAKSPTDTLLHLVAGNIYDNMANPKDASGKDLPQPADYNDLIAKAEFHYGKALELKPTYFDALYNLGALYFNRGVKINDYANSLTDNAKYQKEVAKADEMFKKALPYMEKAEQVKTDDPAYYKQLLSSLQKLYLMTEQPEKAQVIKERLKN